MAQYTRLEVVQQMKESGMVPLFYHEDINVAKSVLKACYDGGARLMEFTSRGDFAIEIFNQLIKYSIEELPGMILGVGSVTDAAAASQYMLSGANFIVTPVFREDIAIVCNRRKVLWSPGCGSLTEIATAEEMGCEVVKLFPGSTYGPGFVKAIKGPQPWTSIMPTGGVSTDESNLRGWFDAGVTCVGMGSQLISKDILANKSYDELSKNVKDTLALIQTLKG
ncbi:bifunctional 4-hydroxy-2-oxoglutarate aldolase/2-dehydro-3-deoxy-phosphogluconate aldolase [Flavobacteriaceae bacterium]|jgi:2-dehydro-3-deoxyphosphogluconate aldolase/(4S)-4-hydroxy-2-oxoglutarate aldolase|nr:bifunctional 4-hydroxy-2-oxoglutarate aldolase/2-dehydro-3-deoxy-phosphogluconate aldolase [Flavobacteriaceae bacterium]MDB2456837.1 bifunctional 4-hydroxy-2-oxoglutarate aldolase/2-dehydro-3-deoxy-phosphogluconate aldolase [Flavobacteriaceae bacterium]MDB4714754.1 bifunctional 4-hydroxy-2-oxoglutarate aldolase/2-dehydro-3-deoxy-phosphogluconate aldolase [Flavobacteriaceae bacterium]MDB4738318.1 bifunctional 4-hydroxy-2-oxoglutarate aldolase/2-dehydro-3-deoxy-phosphogluconate aldolase [Flavob